MPAKARILGIACLLTGVLLHAPSPPTYAAGSPTAPVAAGSQLHSTPQGKVTQLAIDPSHPNVLYAGTDSTGVYRSDNGGATWVAVRNGLPDGKAIAGLVVAVAHGHVAVYAATENGVYKTTNAGAAWVSQGPPTGHASTSVALDPTAPTTVYAGTNGDGVYRSTNGGVTWAAIGPRLATVQVTATDPISGTTLYAGTDDGLLFMTNGASWQRAGLGHVGVESLGLTSASPSTIYVGTADGVLVSKDSGVSWSRAGLRQISVTTLVVDAQNARSLYAASADGGGLFYSNDGGRHWQTRKAGLSSTNVASFAIDPSDPQVAYTGLDHGVFKSLQAGVSWASSSIYDRSVHSLLQPASASNTYYAGTNGGVYASTDGGAVWTSGGLGNHTVVDLLPIAGGGLLAATEAGVYRTTDGGHSWPVTLRLPIHALISDPSTPQAVLVGTSAGLFRSLDDGQRWERLAAGSGEVDALLITADHRIFAGGASGLVISKDAGVSFTRYNVNGENVQQLLAQAATRATPMLLFARTASGHIYRSIDEGAHWVDASVGGTTASALALGADLRLYAATERGIYRSSSKGISWILTDQQDQGLRPLTMQPSLGADKATLLEGLDGQGVIARTLHTLPTSPFAPPVTPGIGQYFQETGHYLRAPFLDWYTAHKGAGILGAPRTEAFKVNGVLTQYFQNAILVYHPEFADTPQVIQLQALGAQSLGAPVPTIAAFDNTTKRRYYPQTGHSLSGEFLSFWRAYGGVDVFGYPISEPVMSNGRVVQYFQNVRFEAASSAGEAFFNTRLSPLGGALLKQKGWLL